jgi:hypothetical protein
MLSKEQLRSRGVSDGRRYCLATLADGSEVRLQSLTRSEQRDWRQSTQKKDGSLDPKKQEYSNDVLIAMCIVDDSGSTVYTIEEAINGIFDLWDTADTTLITEVAAAHCRLYVERREVEAALKNSGATRGSGSSGGSSGNPAA